MGKKTEKAINNLRSDLQELTEAFWAFREGIITQQATTQAEAQNTTPLTSQSVNAELLQERTTESDEHGYVSGFGYYESPETGKAIRWSMPEASASSLHDVDLDAASRVLAALGHAQRMRIALLLTRRPSSVNEIVDELGMGTTGAAYHHVNVLQGAGIVEAAERGSFNIVPERLPMLLSVLAGLTTQIATETIDAVSTGSSKKSGKKKKSDA